MQSVESKILAKIRAIPKGKLIFPEDLQELGSSEAVRVALHRLEKEHYIKRVAQGIYVRPKTDKLIGELTPSAEDVAQAIAKRDRVRTIPTGVFALNALGLSTQVPMKIVLLTDGSAREIKVGRRTIKFKKTSPKILSAKGKISKLVIQALKEIGLNNQTEEEEEKIIHLLQKENREDLLHDIKIAPDWIQKIMKKAIKNECV